MEFLSIPPPGVLRFQYSQQKSSLSTNYDWYRALRSSLGGMLPSALSRKVLAVYDGGLGFKDMIATLIRLEIGSSPLGLNQTDRTHFRQNRCVFWYHSGIEPGIYADFVILDIRSLEELPF